MYLSLALQFVFGLSWVMLLAGDEQLMLLTYALLSANILLAFGNIAFIEDASLARWCWDRSKLMAFGHLIVGIVSILWLKS